MKVAELFDPSSKGWSETKLGDLFDIVSIAAIKRIRIPVYLKKDKLIWILDPKGKFSVKFAFKTDQPQTNGNAEDNWKGLLEIEDP